MSRRFAPYTLAIACLLAVLVGLTACKKTFVRPPGLHDLGEVRFLIQPYVHVQDKMMLVTFDEETGWSVMSTRCTLDGCDLSYLDGEGDNPDVFFNPCARIYYSFEGKSFGEKAPRSLPYYAIRYSDGHLYADSGKEVPKSYRFMTDELRAMLPTMKKMNKVDGVGELPRIPKVLQGQAPDGSGRMFTDEEYIDDF